MGGERTLSLIYFTLSIYILYLAYKLYDPSKRRGYLALAILTTGIYTYLEFVSFNQPHAYLLIFKLESTMYILGSYYFYRSFRILRGKFSVPSFVILIGMILYVLLAPTATEVRIYKHYFVEIYTHYWGEMVVIFFYIFLMLFVLEGRKLYKKIDEETRKKARNYMIIIIFTITAAIITRFLCLYFFIPHLDPIVFAIGYTVLYLFFLG